MIQFAEEPSSAAVSAGPRGDEDFVDFTYINHLVTNDAVIMATFDDPNGARAASILAE